MKIKWLTITLLAIMLAAPAVTYAETGLKMTSIPKEDVHAMSYSTEKQENGKLYSLYIVKKEDGRWVKDIYIRDIMMPPANDPINGKKYKYRSEKTEKIEWLHKKTIYRLYPVDEDDHPSVPFWRNPLK